MNEMIERVAGALFARSAPITKELLFGDRDITWPQVLDGIKDGSIEPAMVWFDEARAAIAAMREPTALMLEQAYWSVVAADVADVWTTMIDAALEEK